METKINYRKELQRLYDSAMQELIEALKTFPDEKYDFITEEDVDDEEAFWNLPIVGIEDPFYSGNVKYIYVTSVSLGKNGIDVTAIDNEEALSQFDVAQELYSLNDVLDLGIYTIMDYLPNGSSESDTAK